MTKTTKKLLPGQPGTKKWVKKYGARLVCVRYQYDLESKIKTKTVELLVERQPWKIDPNRIPKNKIVNIRIGYGETYTQQLVRKAGGRWNKNKQLWELPYREVLDLGLEKRMVKNG